MDNESQRNSKHQNCRFRTLVLWKAMNFIRLCQMLPQTSAHCMSRTQSPPCQTSGQVRNTLHAPLRGWFWKQISVKQTHYHPTGFLRKLGKIQRLTIILPGPHVPNKTVIFGDILSLRHTCLNFGFLKELATWRAETGVFFGNNIKTINKCYITQT